MADALTFWQILGLLNEQFPQYVPLLAKPGVFDVLSRMMQDGNTGHPWTGERVQSELQGTPYFKENNDKERAWDALQATNPATAQQQLEVVKRQVDDLQAQLGVTLDQSTSFSFFVDAVRNGWDQNEIKYRLLASVNSRRGQGLGSGEVGKTASDIKNMADQYAVPLSDKWIIAKASKVAAGADTMDSVQGYMQEQARSLFPGLKAALDEGQTVRQFAEPYVQLAQQELDINPNDVRFTDPKWMAALNQVDPKTGQRTSMALDSWLQKLRTDPTYGYDTTAKGRQDATTLATQLSQKFGASA